MCSLDPNPAPVSIQLLCAIQRLGTIGPVSAGIINFSHKKTRLCHKVKGGFHCLF